MPGKDFALDASPRRQRQQRTTTEWCLGVLGTKGPQTSGAGLARGGTHEASWEVLPEALRVGWGLQVSPQPQEPDSLSNRESSSKFQSDLRDKQARQAACQWGFWHLVPPTLKSAHNP